MNAAPTYSIIMPVYNAEDTLTASIQSVLDQTFSDWELILIDDGSQDQSRELAERFAHSDQRVHTFCQKNAGPSAARNLGIQMACGQFFAFLDADDLWHPDRLAGFQDTFMMRPEVGVLFSRTQFMSPEGRRLRTVTSHIPLLGLERLLAENPVCSTSNIVCRRDVMVDIGVFESGLDYAEDQDWLVRVAAHGEWAITGMNRVWFYYRSSPDSQSADLEAMHEGWHRLIDRARSIRSTQVSRYEASAHAVFCRQLARRALRKGDSAATAWRWLKAGFVSDSATLLRQPKRTGLTALGILLAGLPITPARELVKQ